MLNSNNISKIPAKLSEHELKVKVRDLEAEVKSLKTKLDELRKAKNTTLIKKEKEYVTSITAKSNVAAVSRNQSQEDDLSAFKAEYEQEISALNEEIKKLKLAKVSDLDISAKACGHEEIIQALQTKLAETESLNEALSLECEQLQAKLTQSYYDMSCKEAEHCQTMQDMKVELQAKWQEMYKEWMRTTEAKIAELQTANDMMRRLLGPRT